MSTSQPVRGIQPLLLVILLATVAGILAWWFHQRTPDWDAVFKANNEGIGWMEQFQYAKAVPAFEKVVQLAPDWTPGRINLGIALLNTATDSNLEQAIKLFQDVVKKHPDNPHAHYCLGMIFQHKGQGREAYRHYQAVTRIDPNDAHSWHYAGKTNVDGTDSTAAKECFEKAVRLNPNLNAARYALAHHPLNRSTPDAWKTLLDQHGALKAARWEEPADVKYAEMGPYAGVIGRDPNARRPAIGPVPTFEKDPAFEVKLASGARWAKGTDLDELQRAMRARFGGTLVLLDYNGDGRPDVLMLGAVVEGGKVRDLLLRNEGKGKFTDVTAKAGLGGERISLGCCVADFDNDGHPDLLITTAEHPRLFRNNGADEFEDVTAKAGMDKLKGVCLGCAAVDLDQDGDLDFVLARYAGTVQDALKQLRGEEVTTKEAGLVVFINRGEAPPIRANEKVPGLSVRFSRAEKPSELLVEGPMVGLLVSDLDGDHDVDLVALPERGSPEVILNDRLLRFHRAGSKLSGKAAWNGGLVFNLDHSDRSAILLLRQGDSPVLLRNEFKGEENLESWFKVAPVQSPPLRQAQAIDLDHDSWTDVVGLSEQGQPVLLHNDGTGRLLARKESLGTDWPTNLVSVTVADLDGNCAADLLLWSEDEGLQRRRNQGNGKKALHVQLAGKREDGKHLRTNNDGIGAVVIAQAGLAYSSLENTTLWAGLGQSRLPLTLGLGKADQADVLRVRWPDGVPQAELNVVGCQPYRLVQENRKSSSCPVLLAWDGNRFGYVTDFLGAGSMGETGPDGKTRPPRPEESVKIEAQQMKPRDGHYVIKIAEPMDEILYLDRLQLLVLDHPSELSVYPDERFATTGPPPTQDLLVLGQPIFPVKAVDHRGQDVTAVLRQRDGKMVDNFAQRSWLGFAEDHFVELDLGDQLAALKKDQQLVLCLAGWIDYPIGESILAASQAGIAMQAPVLECAGSDGKWRRVEEIGFPAGLPRMMAREVTGLLPPGTTRLRLSTNLQVFWDQIYLAPLVERASHVSGGNTEGKGTMRTTALEVSDAKLAVRGFLQQVSGAGGQLIAYNDERTELVAVTPWSGRFTRLGDVTELLRRKDDCFVISGPGEEITVRFDARALPSLPMGWTRSFVLRTWGYCKDSSLFTRTGGSSEPLPFGAMSNYPYGPNEAYPADRLHQDYQRLDLTRRFGARSGQR